MSKSGFWIQQKYIVRGAVILVAGLWGSLSSVSNVRATDEFVTNSITVPTATVRGVVRANAEATLATDLPARVTKIHYREGEAFHKGDLLIEFDCRRYKARKMGAQADYQARKIAWQSNLRLSKRGAIGQTELRISRADMDKALAGVRELEAQTSLCKIHAPYNGRVVEQMIHEYEYAGPSVSLLKIIDDSRLEISLIVPSNWLSWLHKGTAFTFTVDETGKSYPATVKQLGAEVDPVSQTLRIKGVFVKTSQDALSGVLAGMSGTAAFSDKTRTALLR